MKEYLYNTVYKFPIMSYTYTRYVYDHALVSIYNDKIVVKPLDNSTEIVL